MVREAKCAGADRFLGQPTHFGDVLRRCGLAPDCAVTHHVNAQRMMRDLRGHVDRPRQPFERIEKIGEALPIPFQAFGEHRTGNVLDPLHQIYEGIAMIWPHWGEADAAIAKQNGRDAMPRRRRQDRIPGRLPVVMSVNIDPARRDQQSVGDDLAASWTCLTANCGDMFAIDCQVAREYFLASPVNDGAAADDDVVHDWTFPLLKPC